VAVLGHQHIREDFETQFRSEVVEGSDEFALEAIGVKNARPPINVFGQVVVVTLGSVSDAASAQFSARGKRVVSD
jgi:hypothetical protein